MSKDAYFVLTDMDGLTHLIVSDTTSVVTITPRAGSGRDVAITRLGEYPCDAVHVSQAEALQLREWLRSGEHFHTDNRGTWTSRRHTHAQHDCKPPADMQAAIREAVKVEFNKRVEELRKWSLPQDTTALRQRDDPRRYMVPLLSRPVEDVPHKDEPPSGYVVGFLSQFARECLLDVVSHAGDFRDALRARLEEAKQADLNDAHIDAAPVDVGDANRSYWIKQQNVFERIVNMAINALAIHDQITAPPTTKEK